MSEGHFMREVGPRLAAARWPIIPILPHNATGTPAVEKGRGKAPGRWGGYWTMLGGWQNRGVPLADDVARWARWPPHGIGVLCGVGAVPLCGVDIDVRNDAAAEDLDALAARLFGRAPLRIGQRPKRLRVVRTAEPIRRLRTRAFAMPGDAEGDKAHMVELLGAGQQFVAFGTHPRTEQPYVWPEGGIEGLCPEDVPLVTPDRLEEFLAEADAVLERHGGAPKGSIRTARAPARRKAGAHRASRPIARLRAQDADEFRDALRHVKNDDLPRDEWVEVAHAIKGALGEDGRDLFVEWSLTAPKSSGRPDSALRVWESIREENLRSGAGTVFRLAHARGWQPAREPFYPDRGVPLAEAETALAREVGDFFGAVVPGFARQRAEWLAACQTTRGADLEPGGCPDTLFLEPPGPLPPQWGVNVTMGVGKTEAAVRGVVAAVRAGFRGAYMAPQHATAEEVAARINAFSGEPLAQIWRGYTRPDPTAPGETMCRFPELMGETLEAGGSIEDLCGGPKAGCPYRPNRKGNESAGGEVCGYRQQRRKREVSVWVFPSNMLADAPPENMPAPDFVVIDEVFWPGLLRGVEADQPYQITVDSLLERREIPGSDGEPAGGADAEHTAYLDRLQTALAACPKSGPLPRKHFADAGITARGCALAAAREWRLKADVRGVAWSTDTPAGGKRTLVDLQEANQLVQRRVRFWKLLAALLSSDADALPYPRAQRVKTGAGYTAGVVMAWREAIHPKWLSCPVMHIDGTMDAQIVRQWLERLDLRADIQVTTPHVHRKVVTDAQVGKRKVVPDPKASEKEQTTQRNNLADIARFGERCAWEFDGHGDAASKSGRRFDVAIIGPKGSIEYLRENHTAQLGPYVGLGNYNALRGVDEFKNVGCLVLVSRPLPPPAEVERLAEVVFGRIIAPLGDYWYVTECRAFRMEHGTLVAEGGLYHPNPDAEAIRWQICEAEFLQCEARARGARRTAENRLAVIAITNLCVPLTYHEPTTYRALMELAGPLEMLEVRGMFPEDWRGVALALADRFDTPEAARSWFKARPDVIRRREQALADLKDGQTPIAVFSPYRRLTGLWRPFRYRLDGAPRAAVVWVDVKQHADPEAAWARCAGALAVFEPADGKRQRKPRPAGTKAPGARHGAPTRGARGLATEELHLSPPGAFFPAAPSVARLILGTDHRGADALPILPGAPIVVDIGRAFRAHHWPDGGHGAPLTMLERPVAPATPQAPADERKAITLAQIRDATGVPRNAFRRVLMSREMQRLAWPEREQAMAQWIARHVGPERFRAALSKLSAA